MALTTGQINNAIASTHRPIKTTAKEIDSTFEGDIPDTPSSELPPTFNEICERKRVAE